MTDEVAFNDRRVRYVVTNPAGQSVFQYDFPLEQTATDDGIAVYVDDVETAAFTLNTDSSEVTLATPAAQNAVVVLEGDTPLVREIGYSLRGGLPSARLNEEFNQLMYILQELLRDRLRALVLAPSAASGVSTSVTPLADTVLKWNAAGDAIEAGPDAGDIAAAQGYATAAAASVSAAAVHVTTSAANAVAAASSASSLAGVWRNLFLNPAFDIWQDGTSFTITAGAAAAYTADGWMVDCAGANLSVGRVGPSLGATWMIAFTKAAGITSVKLRQRIKSAVSSFMKGKTVTVQFQVYNVGTLAFTPRLTVNRANAANDFSAVTAEYSNVNLQSCGNGFTTVSWTGALSSSSNGFEFILDLQGALNASTAGTGDVYVGDTDVRVATAVQPVEYRPAEIELLRCQEFFEVSEGNSAMFHGDVSNTGTYYAVVPFKVTKRVAPTVTPSNVAIEGAASFNTDLPTIVATKYGFKGTKICLSTSADRGFNFAWKADCRL